MDSDLQSSFLAIQYSGSPLFRPVAEATASKRGATIGTLRFNLSSSTTEHMVSLHRSYMVAIAFKQMDGARHLPTRSKAEAVLGGYYFFR